MYQTTKAALPLDQQDDLDFTGLESFLKKELPILTGSLDLKLLPHGYTNKNYLISMGRYELVLRSPNPRFERDLQREFNVLSHLIRLFRKMPRPFVYYGEKDLTGMPFYIMERLRGVVLRRADDDITLDEPVRDHMAGQILEAMADLHNVDTQQSGLEESGHPGDPTARQVNGWLREYRHLARDSAPELASIASWLSDHIPQSSGSCIVHNDFKLDNLVFSEDLSTLEGIMDWEWAGLGDPFMDLGIALAWWLEPGDPEPLRPLTVACASRFSDREAMMNYYLERVPFKMESPLFYYIYGLFVASISLSGRALHETHAPESDPRQAARAFAQQAQRALEQQKISGLTC